MLRFPISDMEPMRLYNNDPCMSEKHKVLTHFPFGISALDNTVTQLISPLLAHFSRRWDIHHGKEGA